MQELQKLKKFKKGLIIHHWDTDGLCSAALILNFLQKVNPQFNIELRAPKINNYYLLDEEFQEIEKGKFDFIISCDINFPEAIFNRLSMICPAHVYVFDHHKQAPLKSVFYHNKNYPSCSLVINEYLQQELNLVAVLGAIGDKEEKIKKDEFFWPLIQTVLTANNISLPEALHMRNLIDSCYQTNDYYSFNEIIELLMCDPLVINDDTNLRKNLIKINKILTSVATIKPLKTIDQILLFPIKSNYNILSQCTRLLSRRFLNNYIITWQKQKNQTNIYIRRGNSVKDLTPIITWARSKGFNAGGKNEVVGIIYNGDFENIQNELIAEIKKI